MAAGEQPNNKPQVTALVSATRGARRMGAIPILDNILKTCRTNSQIALRATKNKALCRHIKLGQNLDERRLTLGWDRPAIAVCSIWRRASGGGPSGVGRSGAKRFSVQRKMAIVARLLRGEPLELVVRETNVSIARLSEWRDRALAARLQP